MVYSLLLTVAVGFCSGNRIDGTTYRDFISASQAGYKNEPSWSQQVRRGQQQAVLAGLCEAASF